MPKEISEGKLSKIFLMPSNETNENTPANTKKRKLTQRSHVFREQAEDVRQRANMVTAHRLRPFSPKLANTY